MTAPDHAPRCECCRELARLRAASARVGRIHGGRNRSACAACGTLARGPRKRRQEHGKWVRYCLDCAPAPRPRARPS